MFGEGAVRYVFRLRVSGGTAEPGDVVFLRGGGGIVVASLAE